MEKMKKKSRHPDRQFYTPKAHRDHTKNHGDKDDSADKKNDMVNDHDDVASGKLETMVFTSNRNKSAQSAISTDSKKSAPKKQKSIPEDKSGDKKAPLKHKRGGGRPQSYRGGRSRYPPRGDEYYYYNGPGPGFEDYYYEDDGYYYYPPHPRPSRGRHQQRDGAKSDTSSKGKGQQNGKQEVKQSDDKRKPKSASEHLPKTKPDSRPANNRGGRRGASKKATDIPRLRTGDNKDRISKEAEENARQKRERIAEEIAREEKERLRKEIEEKRKREERARGEGAGLIRLPASITMESIMPSQQNVDGDSPTPIVIEAVNYRPKRKNYPRPNHPNPTPAQPLDPDENHMSRRIERIPDYEAAHHQHDIRQPTPPSIPPSSQLDRLIADFGCIENELNRLLASWAPFSAIGPVRDDLSVVLDKIALLDLERCVRDNLDQRFWRFFHQYIDGITQRVDNYCEVDLLPVATKVIEFGTSYYRQLIGKLEQRYQFFTNDLLKSGAIEHESRTVKLARICIQRCFISLGDLERYAVKLKTQPDYSVARNWYMKAQAILPKNGRPYNLLAIVAVYSRKAFDAAYFYMRSLAVSKPVMTARESLIAVFEEACKKAIAEENRRLEDQKQNTVDDKVEVWILPDGSYDHNDAYDPEDELQNISQVDLYRRFMTGFLYCHAKLFTKVGMDGFPDACGRMLYEFRVLLNHSHSPMFSSINRLVQITVMNIFAIHNAPSREERVDVCRTVLQEHAVQLGLDMLALIAERCVNLFESSSSNNLCDDHKVLLPCLKLWADWLLCHPTLWNPPPCISDPELGPNVDAWSQLAKLCNHLSKVKLCHIEREDLGGLQRVYLDEDILVSGFVPLVGAPNDPVFISEPGGNAAAKDRIRIEKVLLLGDFLCGLDEPVLDFVEKHGYIAVSSTVTVSEMQPPSNVYDEPVEFDNLSLDSEDSYEGEDEIGKLRRQHRNLSKMHKTHSSRSQAMLESERHTRRVKIEVRPKYIFPDTNCFIDHLPLVQRVVESKRFTLVVPLIVATELDGLATGARALNFDDYEHAGWVAQSAQTALKYLNEQFHTRHPNIKAITSEGTLRDSIFMHHEESHAQNDDIVLQCCLKFCMDSARDFLPSFSGESMNIIRNLVLLTDDRNLRVKTMGRHIPVRNIRSFCKWAQL